jgi:hypothetical protein
MSYTAEYGAGGYELAAKLHHMMVMILKSFLEPGLTHKTKM